MSMDIIKTLIKVKKYFSFLFRFPFEVPASFSTFNAFIQFIFIMYGIIAYKIKGRATEIGMKSEKNRKMEEITVFNFSISCC